MSHTNLLATIPADLYIHIILPYLDIKSALRLKGVSRTLRAIVAEYQSTYTAPLTIVKHDHIWPMLKQFPQSIFTLLNPAKSIKNNPAIVAIKFKDKSLKSCIKHLQDLSSVVALEINFATLIARGNIIMIDQKSVFSMIQLTHLDMSMEGVPEKCRIDANLSNLVNLTILKLVKCSNVRGIPELVNLISLTLVECHFSEDIDGYSIRNLTQLRYLKLSSVDLVIHTFTYLVNLEKLYTRYIQLFIHNLEVLTKLRILSIINRHVTYLNNIDFSTMTNLVSLSLKNIRYETHDLSPLVNLTELYLYNCPRITPPTHQLKYYINKVSDL